MWPPGALVRQAVSDAERLQHGDGEEPQSVGAGVGGLSAPSAILEQLDAGCARGKRTPSSAAASRDGARHAGPCRAAKERSDPR